MLHVFMTFVSSFIKSLSVDLELIKGG